MRTIVTTQDKYGNLQKFSFETSPLLDQDEQIKKVLGENGLKDLEILYWQYFDAHEL